MLYPLKTEKANLELVLDSGPARVEFEEVDFYEIGKLCRKKYLMHLFPTVMIDTLGVWR